MIKRGAMVEICRCVIEGRETDFMSAYFGIALPAGHEEECAILADALASAQPHLFIKTVGVFLHDYMEVA